ncbi:MAG TPA: GGDEF domain-containing protein [Ilumatobacteraceae bacterium]|nr:GGDEF domain-containing protein [Ilumatobacteraceae bacterium]
MKLIRIAALVGSVILLVATTVSIFNKAAEQRAEQKARVIASVLMADQAVDSAIVRGLAVVDVATAETDLEGVTRSFGDSADACIATAGVARCTGPDLGASSVFGDAVAASVESGGPAVAVDNATDSLLVVSYGDVTTALILPTDSLLGPSASSAAERSEATIDVALSSDITEVNGEDLNRVGPSTVDDRLIVADTFALPGDGGSVRVTASIADDAGLVGDGLALYLLLLGFGTVLLALAGWTFLLDRRSLKRQATTDDLTGLPNRREFERQTEEALLAADRFKTGVCLMLIDLNGFKAINDTLGHQFGDLVLRAATRRLLEAVRDTDVVGRWGGDEFVVLLPGVQDASAVRSSAERIGALLGGTPIADDVTVTAAIGAALYPRHGTTLDDLIRAADDAMYGAKTTGVTHRLADTKGTEFGAGSSHKPDRRRTHSDDDHRV